MGNTPDLDYKLLEQFSFQEVIKIVQDAERDKKVEYRRALASDGKYKTILEFLDSIDGTKHAADVTDKVIRTFFEKLIDDILADPGKYYKDKDKGWVKLFDGLLNRKPVEPESEIEIEPEHETENNG